MRPPNLITVPGDPIAGFLLASVTLGNDEVDILRVWPCLVSALLLYVAGLILNDCADAKEDGRDRPERPIPSGKVSRCAALWAGMVLGMAGMTVAKFAGDTAFSTAVLLALLIVIYNFVARRVRLLGAIVMGMCRGCSLLLGASAITLLSPLVITAAIGVCFYIMDVTRIAMDEAEGKVEQRHAILPPMVLVLVFGMFHYRVAELKIVSVLLAVCSVAWTMYCTASLKKANSGGDIPKQVGHLIRGQLLVQASFCAVADGVGLVASAGLLLLWPIGILLARKFYAS
ncbi:hypothetical protein BVX97_01850 [bacterium E08(2017)]|nr:hypothetical protein BVX97_01850 [bacterium E08(2017)]